MPEKKTPASEHSLLRDRDWLCGADACFDREKDAAWKDSIGLDLGDRSVLEAEFLLWRIAAAKCA